MKKNLNKAIEMLEKAKQDIEEKIIARDEIFENRSDNWQDSDKGMAFQVKTDNLQNVFDDVEEVIDSLREWMSE